ncbi:WecB/TagA/CpsF family glycosyltransferase [Bacteroides mediterraneensis]|uniref:WecB/TagA/CpsF family glycosyltransferase n=1 Tax=Bacteroides mediterraneensis TaxID=1841856 RepID=A0ABS2EWP2_9BACE|nr:WecB/TagA/CpsF family glycosyltransferase [Bacteroides mediterraneensis]MBM6759070.1 WecB/TagA/CpsF family glycosyltransferase [Bacteroides mediterraneensis]
MNCRFLNINIRIITKDELLHKLDSGVLVTPNIDHLVKLQTDKEFYDAYQQAKWVVCDSQILYFISKILKNPLPEAIPGSSFFTAFYEYHRNNPNCRIFLLGAAEGVAIKAMERINKKVGRAIIVGAHSPSYGFEKKQEECEELIQIVNESGANVLLVGVGAPKQEKWIIKYRDRMPQIDIFMALGATIDFEAGTLKRAPIFWQKIGMEWLYRCLKEPKRLFKRYFIDDMKFFYYFSKQILGCYKNPFQKTEIKE